MAYSGRSDFQTAARGFEPVIDERSFAVDDVQQVATCLRDYDEQVLAHEFLLPEAELWQMALESAFRIVEARRQRFARQLADCADTSALAAS